MIDRPQHLAAVRRLLAQFPVVGLLGARQVGKTTLARQLVEGRKEPTAVFDLEDPTDRARLADPKLALEPLAGLVVLDEVQHLPEVFPLLR
ncbi:MAG TPA: AAA family ATPase, partial [Thermoanaerobaculia bacterium]